jgi:F420-dependent oxidoreductase-like protein
MGAEGIVNFAVKAEALGYDSLWAADHLIMGGPGGMYEVWTVLSTVAARTSRIRIGPLVLCNSHRSPALVAKMAATLDVLSGGRLDLGLGAGWYKAEQLAYGLPWVESPRERLAMMEEAVVLTKALFTQPRVTFNGAYYRVADAVCQPSPVQKPWPPIWIGGAGEKVLLRIVAKHADAWNVPALTVDEYAHKLDVIREHCGAVGRDYDAIEKSMETRILFFDRASEMERVVDWYHRFMADVGQAGALKPKAETGGQLRDQYLLGSVAEVTERVGRYVEAGVQHFMLYFLDYPSTEGLERFASDVMPWFKQR